MKYLSLSLLIISSSLINSGHSTPFNFTLSVNGPNGFSGFGRSIAEVNGNILVGAPDDNVSGNGAGGAYLFDGQTGALLQTFLNPTPEGSPGHDSFGVVVASYGNNVLIANPSENAGGDKYGEVYLFDSQTGALLHTFENPTPEANDHFGSSIAVLGNKILIGTPYDNTGATSAGAVYLFDGNTGDLLHTFFNPDPDLNDAFGDVITAVGNNVLIGAQFDGPGNSLYANGVTYLFDGNTGDLLHTFHKPDSQPSDRFGSALTAIGNNIFISAIGAFVDNVAGSGAVYMFDGNTGNLINTILNPTPDSINEGFGFSLASIGDYVVIGSPDDTIVGPSAGAAYLWDSVSGEFVQTFISPSPDYGDFFGGALAVGSNKIMIGAIGDDAGGNQTGSVYIFQSSSQPVPEPSTLLLLSIGLLGIIAYRSN